MSATPVPAVDRSLAYGEFGPGKPFVRYLDTNGDGTGIKDALGDYQDPTAFFFKPTKLEGVTWIWRFLVHIQDAGNFDAGSYGNGIVLANGYSVVWRRGGEVLVDFNDGVPTKTNADWARLCYDVDLSNFGVGDNYLHARFSFWKMGKGIRFDPKLDDQIEVILNDDYSDLTGHFFNVQGWRCNE